MNVSVSPSPKPCPIAPDRRYEECKKIRDTGPDKLHVALCARRSGIAVEEASDVPKAGWSSIARKQAPATAPAPRVPVRGAAAVALDAAKKASAKSNSWASQTISFAQRLRAEAVARVRKEAEGEEAEGAQPEDGFWNESLPERPPAPPVPGAAKEVPKQGSAASKAKPGPPSAPSRAPLSALANGAALRPQLLEA